MGTARRMLALAAVGLACTVLPAEGRCVSPPSRNITLDVRLDPIQRLLAGTCRISFTNTSTEELQRVPLYLYPNLLATAAKDLDDVTFPHRFPGAFSGASMELGEVRVDGLAAVSGAVGPGEETFLTWVTLPRSATPDSEVVLEFQFRTRIPERFGPFGVAGDTVVLLGGWHPLLPRLDRDGFALDDVHPTADVQIRVAAPVPGLLVLGDRVLPVSRDAPAETSLAGWSGPVLLYHRSNWHLTRSREPGRRPLVQVSSARHNGAPPEAERVRGAVRAALAEGRAEGTEALPYLLLEAPLREMIAIPVRGGLLYSDLAFAVAPLRSLEARHAEDLQSAAVASNLLSNSKMDLFEALLTINLVQFVRWEEGKADPIFLRRFLQQVELWGSLDKMGTDPQSHFQTSMFFTPEIPAPLRRTPALFARDVPSPRSAARMVYNLLGPKRVLLSLTKALAESSRLLPHLLSAASPDEMEMMTRALRPMRVDLALGDGRMTPEGYEIEACKLGDAGPLPLELLISADGHSRQVVVPCLTRCCTISTGANATPQVTLDPHGLLLQETSDNNHPRHNDRNHVDLKWVLNRPYLSFAGGDRFPSMGLELQVEPRWDLHNRFALRPSITSRRGTVSGSWRHGFGRKVRPTYLADSVSLGLRAAFPLDGSDGGLLGPILSYVHYTRQSRMNPYRGNWSYLFAYPLFTPDLGQAGSRFGAMTSQLFGRSPDHVLALRLNADTGLGWIPDWDVPATGGIDGLRALGSYQMSARHRAGASVEYRFMPVRNLHASVLRLGYLTALQLAVFVDGATIADDLDVLFSESATLVDVGLGIRPHADILGILPGIVSLDVAYLLPVLGATQGGVNLVLSFYQPF